MSTGSTSFSNCFDSFGATATAASLFSFEPSSKGFNAYSILRDLITTLQTNHVPGPLLLRTSTEYTDELGKGGYAIVLGANERTIERERDVVRNGIPRRFAISAGAIAVKQHRSRGKAPANETQAREYLGKHFKDAMREIIALSHPSLRDHPNIVKLLGWGLCLDALEDESLEKVNIPLLVLEKAEGDLLKILSHDKASARARVSVTDRFKLCADIGRGLEALHTLGLSHGDLKPNNILVFRHGRECIAKLCDFGTANGLVASFGKHSSYRGTERWRAPEVLPDYSTPPNDSLGLIRCDIYTYGLVVWAVFASDGQSLVNDESCPTILEDAESSLQQRALSLSWRQRRLYGFVLQVIKESLPYNPSFRNLQPWRHFVTPSDRLLDAATHTAESTLRKLQRLWADDDDSLSNSIETGDYSPRNFTVLRYLTSRPRVNPPLVPFDLSAPISVRRKIDGYAAFARAVGFDDLVSTESTDNAFTNSGHIHSFDHETSHCLEIPWLQEFALDVTYFLNKPLSQLSAERFTIRVKADVVLPGGELDGISAAELLYCFARFRSRLKLCCWRRLSASQRNFVSDYVRYVPTGNFSTLAWFCRGEVGRLEVQDLPRTQSFVTLHSPPGFTSFDNSRRLGNYSLLMQSGLPIHVGFKFGGAIKTSLVCFCMSLRDSARPTAIQIICDRFQQMSHASDATRNFMLCTPVRGNCPEKHSCTTTSALHEFAAILDYGAVEKLVASGANTHVQATLLGHKTPLQVAESAIPETRRQELSKYRITSLLASKGRSSVERSSSSSYTTPLMSDWLPAGWVQRSVYENPPSSLVTNKYVRALLTIWTSLCCTTFTNYDMDQVAKDVVYYEEFTGSLTWKRPTFSLLSGGRVALGYRKLQGCYLDLISFLTPPRSSTTTKDIMDRFPLIDDAWYMREPFTESRVDDPLSQLTETWADTFMDRETRPTFMMTAGTTVLPIILYVFCIALGMFLTTRGFSRP